MKFKMAVLTAREEVARRDGTIAQTKVHREPTPDLVIYRERNGQYMVGRTGSVYLNGRFVWSMEEFAVFVDAPL